MRFVVQRVSRASVRVGDNRVASIGHGLLVLVGFHRSDEIRDCEGLLDKLLKLRIFADEAGKMNGSVRDVGGAILLVPQFTLYADTRRGNRPSFLEAAPPEQGEALFDHLVSIARTTDVAVEAGIFRAHMDIELVNVGPVTIILES